MPELLVAHGGTAGLFVELAFLAVPILVFTAMAVISSRRRHAQSEEFEADDGHPANRAYRLSRGEEAHGQHRDVP